MKTDKPRELCELHDDWVGKEGTLCDCGNGEGVCKRDKPDHTLLDRIKDEPRKGFYMTHYDEAVRFYNESYSGTEMSEFLKPYVINSYLAGKRSTMK